MAVGCVVCADDAEDGGLSLGSRERVGEEVNMVLVVVRGDPAPIARVRAVEGLRVSILGAH